MSDQPKQLGRRSILMNTAAVATAAVTLSSQIEQAQAQAAATVAAGGKAPNILVIWGDDVGITDISAYSMGLMGFRTPNIDRLAREGMLFTDSYGEQSCTAGRSAFITGQSVLRTGLSKVGLPGAPLGMSEKNPTIATLLKARGYTTGQFGKNHLGDRNEHLPTVHGFDEFYGNLYHLNAEEEPELPDYPTAKDFPNFRQTFGPRGVLHTFATETDDPTVDPRFGRVGKQKIEDTGPLTKKRMEIVDDDIAARAVGFIEQSVKAGKPFFTWVNFTHMHFRTHPKPEVVGQAGRWQSPYHDVMMDHDKNVGSVVDTLDRLGIADNTIVIYSTDNGPHMNSWPDAAMTPFRNEKNSNWEGAYRIPEIIRWPGKIKPGSVSNEIVQHADWLPTMLAAAGDIDVVERLKAGATIGGKSYKVHIDGFNLLPYLTGQTPKGARESYFYFSDEGDLVALRYDNWKFVFAAQEATGTLKVWQQEFTHPRVPYIINLRTDPFERAMITSNTYYDWLMDHAFLMVPAQTYVAQFLATFKEFPPSAEAASFTVGKVLESLKRTSGD